MIEEKLKKLKSIINNNEKLVVLILGLGSVGNYLLNYLLSSNNDKCKIIVAGRNREKLESDVNIAMVSALIRKQKNTYVKIYDNLDLESIDSISECLIKCKPDIIINTSRVYSGLKYGSISWNTIRAYGIWAPLAIKYIRNIMIAYKSIDCDALVINTSYSDATIPWLKSAGLAYPDFGSGNLNHILPRVKIALAKSFGIDDFWNIEVSMATSHFHDVLISKEGKTNGLEQLIIAKYHDRLLNFDQTSIFSECKIPMPSDSKRNMMNASSNYEIICSIIKALQEETEEVFHSPGAFGEIGGYPVLVDGKKLSARIDERNFNLKEMKEKNRLSIAFDGIKDIKNGNLEFTDELIEKVHKSFNVSIPKIVNYSEINQIAEFIINNIIKPNKTV